jgi:toxin ParE1/3/4
MRSVVWSDEAARSYLDILRYIAEDNPFAAEKVVDAIEKTGNDLGDFATGRPGRVSGTYEKVVAQLPYLIAYTITNTTAGGTISILRIIHMSRGWRADEWPE